MQIEFDQATFRRLVKLYLWMLPLLIVVVGIDLYYITGWEFSDAFDALVAQHFSPLIDEDVFLGIGVIVLLVHLAATFALLKFQSWARPLFVWPPFALIALDVATLGYPVFTSALMTLLTTVSSALYGAIALLCYGKNQGNVWFFNNDNSGT
jgi:hypothetical protein